MAELTVSIIPVDPCFVPERKAATKAKASLRRYYEWAENPPKVEFMPQPHFFYGDDNCDRFVCPSCSKTVRAEEVNDMAGHPDTWRELLRAASNAPDALAHELVVPCCKTSVMLRELAFRGASGEVSAAIGSFRLSVIAYDDILSQERLARLQKALGCEIRQMVGVWA